MDCKEVQVVLTHIRDNMRSSANQREYIRRRFQYADWRGHLISAIAMLLADDRDSFPADDLWRAFDKGSWVAPQLAVTTFFLDKAFVEHAHTRIEARCPVAVPEGMSSVERHVATGPSGEYGRSCKALSSLLTLLEYLPGQSEWVAAASQQVDVKQMLTDDLDHAGEIARLWHSNAVKQFARLGIVLEPAAA
ncbi:MAG TPA: hypothetical protein VL866_23625 [Pyrinomonadaceae bacterium]|nr:hypothetical protein [Pyrinomonadaceae bacterium]